MSSSISAILLAAGLSVRMGQSKQLLDWGGKPLLCHVAEVALASEVAEVLVVLGKEIEARSQESEVLAELELVFGEKLKRISNPDHTTGQASSLRAGLAAVAAESEAALVMLVDQPLITTALINTLLATYRAHDAWALIPRFQNQRGNPVILGRPLFAEVQQLQGDSGARIVLQRYPERIAWLDIDDAAVISDMDTPEAYRELYKHTFGRS
jgi:molybdenum cofactor cytidylyltransferase